MFVCVCTCCTKCESDFIVRRPCEGDLSRQPYAKRECGLLYSDVFAACHNVVSVSIGSFVTYSVFNRKKVIAYPRRTHTQSNTCLLVMHQQISVAKGKSPQ